VRQLAAGLAQETEGWNDGPPLLRRQPARELLAQDGHVAQMRLEVDELQARLDAVDVGV
jgi:hypothetical protein